MVRSHAVKKIVVLGTGGTIAGTCTGDGPGAYAAAQVGVQALLAGLPGPAGLAVVSEQIAQIDSKDMDVPIWQALLRRCLHWLAQPDVQGLVITHGTDTLEETAFLLHCLLPAGQSVVLTCAMRPSDAPDADGPANLRDALAVAAEPVRRGVVLVCAGRILGAREVQKVHTQRLNAFSVGDVDDLGAVHQGQVRWTPVAASAAKTAQDQPLARVPALAQVLASAVWPRVEIVLSHAAADGAVVDALLESTRSAPPGLRPVQGLVVAATGAGTVHQALEAALRRARAAGVWVWISTRCPWGAIAPTATGAWPGVDLPPVKARLALMLTLMASSPP